MALPLLATVLAACGADAPVGVSAPVPASNPRAAYRAIAFTLDFNLGTGSVTVSSASAPAPVPTLAPRDRAGGVPSVNAPGANGASYSLLDGSLVNLQISNLTAGTVGAVAPNKVLIRADLTVVNPLSLALVTPTSPVPPVGITGLQAFPFEILAKTRDGTGQFVVSLPSTGPVQPSADWDGPPHNFFNDVACELPQSDCFPYKGFPQVAPLSASPPRGIGFLVDVSVLEFRALVLLAADLQSVQGP